MIRPCSDADFDAIYAIINDAAQAYRGVIPADRWHDPYMSKEYFGMKSRAACGSGAGKRAVNWSASWASRMCRT